MAETLGGIGGNMTLAGFNFKLQAWEATQTNPISDITGFDSDDWTESYPHGVTSLSARAMGTGKDAAGATIQGSGGQVDLGSWTCKFDTWVLNLGSTITDTTGFVDAGYSVVEPMLGVGYGTCTGTALSATCPFYVAALGSTIVPANFIAPITLTVASGIFYDGDALITNVRVARSITDKMIVTFDYRFTADIGQTWATNPPLPAALLAVPYAPANVKASVTLTADTGKTIAFPGVVTNCQIRRAENAKCDVEYTIQSRGQITWSW